MPTLNLLIGHAKFVSMNLLLVWQDRALSVLLRSEIPSGMCAKLRTVAANNN